MILRLVEGRVVSFTLTPQRSILLHLQSGEKEARHWEAGVGGASSMLQSEGKALGCGNIR